MELSMVAISPQENGGSARSVLGTITNSPRAAAATGVPQVKTPQTKTPRGSPSMSPRQRALAAQRPSFPYLRRQQDGCSASSDPDPAANCKYTPKKEQLGSLLASLKVEHPQIGVKKLKVKVQEKEPAWKVGCKEIRCGLNTTPVRQALCDRKIESTEKGMLEASLRTGSVDVSFGRDDKVVSTSPERSKSEGSLVDCMRASLAFDTGRDRSSPGLPSSDLSLVDRMKACRIDDCDTRSSDVVLQNSNDEVSTHLSLLSHTIETTIPTSDAKKHPRFREELVPPPPPPRDNGPPPPLPPRDHVVAAVSALKLGMRWKSRAMQAAAERESKAAEAAAEARIESQGEADPLGGETDDFSRSADEDTSLTSAVREQLVPPPPPPRDNGPPPPLPPRDHVVAAVSALKLGMRWKSRAMQAAAERESKAAEAAAEARIESQGEADLLGGETDVFPTDEDEDSLTDPGAEQRRRAFLQTATSVELASPVMHSQYPQELNDPTEDDILASPTVEARSRRSAFLRRELTDNALLRSAEKFIAARTLSSLEEMQMSPLRTLSWSNGPSERTESGSSSSSSSSSTATTTSSSGNNDESGDMSFEQLTSKLLSAAQVAPSAESRSYLNQLYTTMTSQADEMNRQAAQLSTVQAQADESDAKLKELQAWVQSLATRASVGVSSGSSTLLVSELTSPASHVALTTAATNVEAETAVRLQQRQQAQRKRARGRRGAAGCGCGSRPVTTTLVLSPRASSSQTADGSFKPGAEWTAAIFDKYAEDPSVSQRILLTPDEPNSTERKRLASAALADLVEIVYLPRLACASPRAFDSLGSLLPRSSWNEDGPEWAALTARFGISNGFASGFTREQYFAWDMEVARECSAAAAAPLHSEQQKPKRRWGRRMSKSAATVPTLASPAPQQLREHYSALEAGGEHQLTPTPSCSGSSVSLSPPLMPTVSADVPVTILQDEATQEAVDLLELAAGVFRRR